MKYNIIKIMKMNYTCHIESTCVTIINIHCNYNIVVIINRLPISDMNIIGNMSCNWKHEL